MVPGAALGAAGGMPCVVGQSMAITRREALHGIGGFERFRRVLAEDQAIGLAVQEAGYEVALSPVVVRNVVVARSVHRAVDRSTDFRGRYHVLGGRLSPLDGVGPEALRLDHLVARVRDGGVREVILATNPSMEGEVTATYIQQLLAGTGVRVTRLARGLPMGGDLEYVDGVTLAHALVARQELCVLMRSAPVALRGRHRGRRDGGLGAGAAPAQLPTSAICSVRGRCGAWPRWASWRGRPGSIPSGCCGTISPGSGSRCSAGAPQAILRRPGSHPGMRRARA